MIRYILRLKEKFDGETMYYLAMIPKANGGYIMRVTPEPVEAYHFKDETEANEFIEKWCGDYSCLKEASIDELQ